jgi:hypothetical protein
MSGEGPHGNGPGRTSSLRDPVSDENTTDKCHRRKPSAEMLQTLCSSSACKMPFLGARPFLNTSEGGMNTAHIRRYLAKCEPAIAGQHGHNTTFRTACKLVWGFGLNPGEAFGFMLEYSARCQPPWNEYELRRKLDQALKHSGHQKPRGYLLGQDYTPVIDTNIVTPMPASPVWPKPDIERIESIVSEGPGLYDLWKKAQFASMIKPAIQRKSLTFFCPETRFCAVQNPNMSLPPGAGRCGAGDCQSYRSSCRTR